MDFRSLISKLDTLEQRQLLTESVVMAEEVLSIELELLKESYIALMERVRGKELEALRAISDEEQRKKQIAILAVKNNYPGLFDPVTGKWVDYKGDYAWFGPYKAEVEQMEKDGLVPPEAKTSAFLGLMGKDERDAYASSQVNRSKFDLVDDAGDIIDKANKSKSSISENVSKGSIAQALIENFGYTLNRLDENIDEKEHSTLKAVIDQLNDAKYKDDSDVQAIINKYQEYVLYRDQLVAKIKQALVELKSKLPQAKPLSESRSLLKEEIYLVPHSDNTVSAVHFYLNENGDVVEYAVTEDVDALGRGLLAGVTFGWGDNAVAKMTSMYKGTKYGEELAKQLAATEAAKLRSPVWYYGGNIAGAAATSTLIPGSGLVAGGLKTAAVVGGEIASDKYVRTPHNVATMQKQADAEKKSNPVDKVQQSTGQKPTGKMDPASVAAVRNSGAQVSGEVAGIEPELFKMFGVKDMPGLQSKLKQLGATGYEQIGQAIGNAFKIAPAAVTESIIFSSMSESERMTYLRNRMSSLDEALNPLPMLGRLLGIGGEAALLKAVAAVGKEEIKMATGEVWKKTAQGMWSNGKTITDPTSLGKFVQAELKTPAGQKLFAQNNPAVSSATNATTNATTNAAQLNPKNLKNTPVNQTPAPTTVPGTATQAATLSQKLATQYPKVAAVLNGSKSVLKYGWNKKWWLAMAAIIGYAYTNTAPVDPNNDSNNNNNNSDQKVEPTPPAGSTINGVPVTPEQLAIIQKDAGNIKAMMKQLEAMYPADKETKDIRAEVDAALNGIPEAGQPGTNTGSAQKVDATDTSKLNKPGWNPNFTGSAGGGDISGYRR